MSADNTVGIDVCEIRGLVKDLFDKLCGESGREWLRAFKLFLLKQNPWPEMVERVVEATGSLKKIGVYACGSLTQKNTADCFIQSQYYYSRDRNLDLWLSLVQEATDPTHVISHESTGRMSLVQVVQSLYNTPEKNIAALSKMIIKNSDYFTLPQIDWLIKQTDSGEETGLLTTPGHPSMFPVLNKNGKTVFIGVVGRGGGPRWFVGIYRLSNRCFWEPGDRFFSRNTGKVSL